MGTYTARAEQQDGAGNTGRSAARTFAVTSTATAATYRDAVMADAPRAYWRLGEASGTSAADQTASRTPAPTWARPRSARPAIVPVAQSTAVALDGADDSVRVPSSASLNPTAALSLETWIRPSALPAELRHAHAQGPPVPAADQLVAARSRSGSGAAAPRPSWPPRPAPCPPGALEPRGGDLRRRLDGDLRERHGARDAGAERRRGQRHRRCSRSAPAARATGSAGAWTRWPSTAPRSPARACSRTTRRRARWRTRRRRWCSSRPAPGSTADLRPVFAGTARRRDADRHRQGLRRVLGVGQPRADALRRAPVEQPLLGGRVAEPDARHLHGPGRAGHRRRARGQERARDLHACGAQRRDGHDRRGRRHRRLRRNRRRGHREPARRDLRAP